MNLHSLKKNTGATHRRKRVGRGHGSGLGKTSGRGHKGQMARSGAKHRPTFEGGQMPLIRRIPKRGFNNSGTVYTPVNLMDLQVFEDGADVTVEALKEAGLANGKNVLIKVLGDGEIDRKLNVKAHAFSKSAQAKIEGAGGTCEAVKK